MDFENMCRACMNSKSSIMNPLFTQCLAKIFTTCTQLEVSPTDLLPQKLCYDCTELLKSFNNFRMLCFESDASFKSHISSSKVYKENFKSTSPVNFIKLLVEKKTALKKILENDDSEMDCWESSLSNEISEDAPIFEHSLNSKITENTCTNTTSAQEKKRFLENNKMSESSNKTFPYSSSVNEHKKFCSKNKTLNILPKNDMHEPVVHFCGLCSEEYKSLEELNHHIDTHKISNNLTCIICDFKGFDWADFFCHRYCHLPSDMKIQCWTCNKRFTKVDGLEFHVRRQHLGKPPGICKVCLKEFMNIKNWRMHKLIHTGTKPNECKTCGKRFTYKRSLVLHLRCHSDVKKYVCHTCGITFKFHTGLTSHQFRMHSKVQSMVCNHCGKTFKNSETLREHLLRVTSIKGFECPQCNKKYRSQKELENHTKWHSQLKPFQCNQCGKSYKSSNHLNNHLRQHTGERPYRCEICSSSFMTSSVLKKHRMIHTGEKPHVCQVCKKAFIEKSNLKSHLRTHKQFLEDHSKPVF